MVSHLFFAICVGQKWKSFQNIINIGFESKILLTERKPCFGYQYFSSNSLFETFIIIKSLLVFSNVRLEIFIYIYIKSITKQWTVIGSWNCWTEDEIPQKVKRHVSLTAVNQCLQIFTAKQSIHLKAWKESVCV